MNLLLRIGAASFFVLFFSKAGTLHADEAPPVAELKTVSKVDLTRYVGRWYEIARYPNRFQEGCRDTTATYTLKENGTVKVLNECMKGEELSRAEGDAEVVDSETWAKLRVNFVPGWIRWTGVGWGDYWIIDLGKNYEYAVVSEPKREYLWILSREPQISKATFDGILSRLKAQGFTDFTKLSYTRENGVK
jgi:apolipoprotein D and lipocalin family protein